jgi:hypothetical protein
MILQSQLENDREKAAGRFSLRRLFKFASEFCRKSEGN